MVTVRCILKRLQNCKRRQKVSYNYEYMNTSPVKQSRDTTIARDRTCAVRANKRIKTSNCYFDKVSVESTGCHGDESHFRGIRFSAPAAATHHPARPLFAGAHPRRPATLLLPLPPPPPHPAPASGTCACRPGALPPGGTVGPAPTHALLHPPLSHSLPRPFPLCPHYLSL